MEEKKMAASGNPVMETADRVLVITRIFDAPRELVFKAWTDADHLVRWMGPRGFKSTVIHSDARPGGAYRIHMLGPEGDDHWTQGIFREIVEPERLVMSGGWADAQGNPTSPETLLTLTFEEHAGKTKLTLHQAVFESLTARDAHRGGWNSSLDRLAEYLATV
jgi:uncharacterized protein YndB with AHSA1/START domain